MQIKPKIFSVSEAARELGLSAEWLRQGEKRGSLPEARRDRNGYRYYTKHDLERLRNVDCGGVMDSTRITYRPRPDATPEGEVRALAEAYRFILQASEEKKKGARPGTLDDAKKEIKHVSRNTIVP